MRAVAFAVLATAVVLVGAADARAARFEVTNTNNAGPGSLRAAIDQANATAGAPHEIDATGVTGTIRLGTALATLTADVSILGPGAPLLTVRRDSDLEFRIFTINGPTVQLDGLTMSNGYLPTGSGGGAANLAGALTIRQSVVSGNVAQRGGGVYVAAGTATISRSTISGNTARYTSGGGSGGGGIYNLAALTVVNSTVSGNATGGSRGGGIVTGGNELTTIANSTFADNAGSANVYHGSSGQPLMTLRSTLVADQRTGLPNCQTAGNATITSTGYNLADDDACRFSQATDQQNADPLLGPLAGNGGPTPTHALPQGSPAVDRGDADTLTVDQRGLPRPYDFPAVANAAAGDGADVGAFELQAPGAEPPAGPPVDDVVTLLLRGKRLAMNRRRVVRVGATCPHAEQSSPCRGTVTLRTRTRVRFGGRERLVVLATGRFSLSAGETARVRLTLSRRKAQLVRARPGARRTVAIARVRDAAGNRATVTKRMRVVV
jgi:hypothetical protein